MAFDDLHKSLADCSYSCRLKAWARPDLLIIDDVGLGQIKMRDDEPTAVHALYNLIDRRHGRASAAITSDIALSDWGRYLGDAALTAAILDRLAMHAMHTTSLLYEEAIDALARADGGVRSGLSARPRTCLTRRVVRAAPTARARAARLRAGHRRARTAPPSAGRSSSQGLCNDQQRAVAQCFATTPEPMP